MTEEDRLGMCYVINCLRKLGKAVITDQRHFDFFNEDLDRAYDLFHKEEA